MSTTKRTDRDAPLEMTPDEFRVAGHRLVDDIAAFLESLPGRPVAPDLTPGAVRSLLPADLPDAGTDAATLLAEKQHECRTGPS